MTPCEKLGVCNKINCKDCQLSREQSKAKRDEAQTLAKAAQVFGIRLKKGNK
jgi:hypothetical protein